MARRLRKHRSASVAPPLREMRLLDSDRMARLPELRQGDGVCVRHAGDTGFMATH